MNCLEILRGNNQEALLQHFNSLTAGEKEMLLNDLKKYDLHNFFKMIEKSQKESFSSKDIQPIEIFKSSDDKSVKQAGLKAFKENKCAYLMVAGGQGSRLGFDKPKGMFPITPITSKSLFQLHCEKILAYANYAGFAPYLFIMTSIENSNEIRFFFEQNNYFGLKDSVYFFSQGSLPAVDFEGNLILANETTFFSSPDGHGGTLKALKENTLLSVMKNKKIEYVLYFQVDNPLVNIADSAFLGAHILHESEASTKVVEKRNASEKVGVPALFKGKPAVIEYSDLPVELSGSITNEKLTYGYGSIAIHLFNVTFIDKLVSGKIHLPYHKAFKSIPYYNLKSKTVVKPSKPNGIKFEQFIFDAIPLASKAMFYETSRMMEFSPLKNRDGDDSISTCKKSISDYYVQWFKNSGYAIPENFICEISPFFAFSEEIFKSKIHRVINELPNKVYVE